VCTAAAAATATVVVVRDSEKAPKSSDCGRPIRLVPCPRDDGT